MAGCSIGRGRNGWTLEGDRPGQRRRAPHHDQRHRRVRAGHAARQDRQRPARRRPARRARRRRAHQSAPRTPPGTSWQRCAGTSRTPSSWTWEFAGGETLSSITYGIAAANRHRSRTHEQRLRQRAFNRAILDSATSRRWASPSAPRSAEARARSSYLAPAVNSNSGAVPFAQVWIRPQIDDTHAGFTTVPDSGTAAQTLSWLPQSQPADVPLGRGRRAEDRRPRPRNDAPAQALAQVGNTMFVGGKFAGCRTAPAARSTTSRGSPRSTWRPATGSRRSGRSSTAPCSRSRPRRTATSSSAATSRT